MFEQNLTIEALNEQTIKLLQRSSVHYQVQTMYRRSFVANLPLAFDPLLSPAVLKPIREIMKCILYVCACMFV